MDTRPLFVNLPRLREAISKYNGTKTDIAVMEDIARFANRYGRAFPTEKAIAARTGLRRKTVSRSVGWLAAHGFMIIKQQKRGQDKHPRNNYYIVKPFRLRRPDKQSEHYNKAAWKRWCEIGKKRFYNALKRKQAAAGTIRDTAARMAGGKRPTTASAGQLTPAQARDARQKRGGGFAGFGGVLAGLFPTASSAATQPVVKDMYNAENRQRGDMLQALREHEAAAAMASQPTQAAAPTSTAQTVPPVQQPPTQPTPAAPTPSEQRERKARAFDELQQLRESLRRQAAPPAPTVSSAANMAARDVARDYSRASRPAEMAYPWPSSTAATQPVRQAQATADMERDARAAWLAGLEATRRQAARDARHLASQRADYAEAVPGLEAR